MVRRSHAADRMRGLEAGANDFLTTQVKDVKVISKAQEVMWRIVETR
jgi:PleD family two-component response regulator